MTTSAYRQLRIDACNLITFLASTPYVSDDVRRAGIQILSVYVNTCTPDESVAEFAAELEYVQSLIEADMKGQG